MTITHAPATRCTEVTRSTARRRARPRTRAHHARSALRAHDHRRRALAPRLGQALGGARLWRYEPLDRRPRRRPAPLAGDDLKNAAAGLARGGGKSVVCIPAGVTLDEARRHDAMLDLGDAVESLGGAYMTAEDVGTSAELMAVVHERTEHVCGLPARAGRRGRARGCHGRGRARLDPRDPRPRVRLARRRRPPLRRRGPRPGRRTPRRALAAGGARLTVTDVADVQARARRRARRRMGRPRRGAPRRGRRVRAVRARRRADARGRRRAARARRRRRRQQPARLARRRRPATERGIVWAPDFVVNAGGVIYLDVASAPGADQAALDARIAGIGDTVASVLRDADTARHRRRSRPPSGSPAPASTPHAEGRAPADRLVP